MKVQNDTTMVTNPKLQKEIAEQKDSKNVMFLARNTDNKEVQLTILEDNKDNKRVLVALAGNHELYHEVEQKLVSLSKEFPQIARVLISRREAL